MKLVYKKKKKILETKELAPISVDDSSRGEDFADIMRKYLDEINSMAERLLEMEGELKSVSNEFKERGEEFPYYPGAEFRTAAKQLADQENFSALARRLNSALTNYVKLTGPHFNDLRARLKAADEEMRKKYRK